MEAIQVFATNNQRNTYQGLTIDGAPIGSFDEAYGVVMDGMCNGLVSDVFSHFTPDVEIWGFRYPSSDVMHGLVCAGMFRYENHYSRVANVVTRMILSGEPLDFVYDYFDVRYC